MSARPVVPYGATPWHQTSWDWRAAGNFMGGGLGAGIIVAAALSGATGRAGALLFAAGVIAVGLGLGSVALELGRPLRALNVFRNPRTSWMSREAIAAAALMLAGLAAIGGVAGAAAIAAALALVFVYCQARLLQAAKGIPAWREPRVVWLLVATGLAEGAGFYWLTMGLHRAASTTLLVTFVVLLLARVVAWWGYRQHLAGLNPRAARALERAGAGLVRIGTIAPLALLAAAAFAPDPYATALQALAGLCALVAGSWFKFALVTRAAYNRGFVLPQLPVRGARS